MHLEYLEAGADVIVTSSYQVSAIAFTQIYANIHTNDMILSNYFNEQATLPGFQSRGLSMEEAESLLTTSVRIAVEARDKFWTSAKRRAGNNYNRALVAASIGSYGAYLADGSEYRLIF